ncbi:flagellar export protein FliJ [Rhodothermus profundi]|uniref:Flagellar FliJ protein n=1 Tax=Rhodothermus profundi TaxID=633813 RepID=A0A1M6X6W7_9BACT|nr:flagellar export protein FliJ [Rhodothermus profundi]SHL01589.1 flagellar FliJ protein [Rhodothermus profundi]
MPGKKFRFSLQSVLRLRQHQTEQAVEALIRLQQERQKLEKHIHAARQKLEQLQQQLAAQQSSVDPVWLRRQEAYWMKAQQQLRLLEQQLAQLQQQEAEARALVLERRQAEESLERLRERQYARHLEAEAAAERAWIDEQATGAYVRKLQQRAP